MDGFSAGPAFALPLQALPGRPTRSLYPTFDQELSTPSQNSTRSSKAYKIYDEGRQQ